MSKDKVVFNFGSVNMSVFCDGRLLAKIPSVIIITKNLHSEIVAYGEDALQKEKTIGANELFLRPIKKGVVAHFEGAKLLVKEIIKSLDIKIQSRQVCVLISCGLEAEQKKEVEKVFVAAGCSDMFMLEKPLALAPLAEKSGIDFVCAVGGEVTDIAIIRDRSIVTGYALDFGANLINQLIKSNLEENYQIKVSDVAVERLKRSLSSLFVSDTMKYTLTGKDIFTQSEKNITLCSKDIYSQVEYVYSRIVKTLEAALNAAPNDVVANANEKGILFAGAGTHIDGFVEYVHRKLRVFPVVDEDSKNAILRGADLLIQDENFIKGYLGE